MPWQGQYPGQPKRDEPMMSKEDKVLREDREAMMKMGRFEIKAFAKRIQIDITGCVNHEDFVERIIIGTMYVARRLFFFLPRLRGSSALGTRRDRAPVPRFRRSSRRRRAPSATRDADRPQVPRGHGAGAGGLPIRHPLARRPELFLARQRHVSGPAGGWQITRSNGKARVLRRAAVESVPGASPVGSGLKHIPPPPPARTRSHRAAVDGPSARRGSP